MQNCKSMSTLMATTEKLSKVQGTPLEEAKGFQYKSTAGALQYLTLTQPDISYAMNILLTFIRVLLKGYSDTLRPHQQQGC